MKVPLTIPLTGQEEIESVVAVMESGWLTAGPAVSEFETEVARYVGAKSAVASTNCTSSLHLALLLHGIGPGDEVIIPSYTWIATANVVRMVGAKPVFADIDSDTFNIRGSTIEPRISANTKAILLVHQFGLPCDLDEVMGLAETKNLLVIEDAACALGSAYRGRNIGGHGNDSCFSFHPRKCVTTGEGGMLSTDSEERAARARVFLNHGASVSDLAKHKSGTVEALLAEDFVEVGYNYRMTNLQGALGVAQMKRLDGVLRDRRRLAAVYSSEFEKVGGVACPVVPDYAEPNWQSYALRIEGADREKRNAVAQHLLDHEIACRPAYMACHHATVYRNEPADLPVTERTLDSVLILPLFPQMTEEQQGFVIETLKGAAQRIL